MPVPLRKEGGKVSELKVETYTQRWKLKNRKMRTEINSALARREVKIGSRNQEFKIPRVKLQLSKTKGNDFRLELSGDLRMEDLGN